MFGMGELNSAMRGTLMQPILISRLLVSECGRLVTSAFRGASTGIALS